MPKKSQINEYSVTNWTRGATSTSLGQFSVFSDSLFSFSMFSYYVGAHKGDEIHEEMQEGPVLLLKLLSFRSLLSSHSLKDSHAHVSLGFKVEDMM